MHAPPRSTLALADDTDTVELRTVGVDVGSSTTHLAFSLVRLERLARGLSSRFVATSRRQLWRSPVLLTPYLDAGIRLDGAALSRFVADCQAAASISFGELDSGAVLLTGNALERANSAAVATAVAGGAGRFVCAAAGHHLEAELAAHGSGTVAASAADGAVLLNVDVGGGTAKLALCCQGEVVASAAIALGGRLLAWDAHRRLVRLEPAGRLLAEATGAPVELGAVLSPQAERQLAALMARLLLAVVAPPGGAAGGAGEGEGSPGGTRGGRASSVDELLDRLWLTEPLLAPPGCALSFSGGVAELLDGAGERDFGDLGAFFAAELAGGIAARRLAVVPAAERIRATVIGASQFSTQLSGSTVLVPAGAPLPAHGVPVVRPRTQPAILEPVSGEPVSGEPVSGEPVSGEPASGEAAGGEPARLAAAVRAALAERSESLVMAGAVALALRWSGEPSYQRLHALAEGIAAGLEPWRSRLRLVVLALDRDLGRSLGALLVEEMGFVEPVTVTLDELELGELDFLDIGEPRPHSGAVPVVVKSLLFGAGRRDGLDGPPAGATTTTEERWTTTATS